MNEKRIIAIYPNTIGFGHVILNEKGEILDYGMVSIRPVNNEKCLKRIKEIISYYQPEILILENCKNSHKSERVKNLITVINNFGRYKAKIIKYSKEDIRNTFDVFGAKNTSYHPVSMKNGK